METLTLFRLGRLFFAILFVAAISSGCARHTPAHETVHITVDADRGTNVMTINTNGYTMKLGATTFNTNASLGGK